MSRTDLGLYIANYTNNNTSYSSRTKKDIFDLNLASNISFFDCFEANSMKNNPARS